MQQQRQRQESILSESLKYLKNKKIFFIMFFKSGFHISDILTDIYFLFQYIYTMQSQKYESNHDHFKQSSYRYIRYGVLTILFIALINERISAYSYVYKVVLSVKKAQTRKLSQNTLSKLTVYFSPYQQQQYLNQQQSNPFTQSQSKHITLQNKEKWKILLVNLTYTDYVYLYQFKNHLDFRKTILKLDIIQTYTENMLFMIVQAIQIFKSQAILGKDTDYGNLIALLINFLSVIYVFYKGIRYRYQNWDKQQTKQKIPFSSLTPQQKIYILTPYKSGIIKSMNLEKKKNENLFLTMPQLHRQRQQNYSKNITFCIGIYIILYAGLNLIQFMIAISLYQINIENHAQYIIIFIQIIVSFPMIIPYLYLQIKQYYLQYTQSSKNQQQYQIEQQQQIEQNQSQSRMEVLVQLFKLIFYYFPLTIYVQFMEIFIPSISKGIPFIGGLKQTWTMNYYPDIVLSVVHTGQTFYWIRTSYKHIFIEQLKYKQDYIIDKLLKFEVSELHEYKRYGWFLSLSIYIFFVQVIFVLLTITWKAYRKISRHKREKQKQYKYQQRQKDIIRLKQREISVKQINNFDNSQQNLQKQDSFEQETSLENLFLQFNQKNPPNVSNSCRQTYDSFRKEMHEFQSKAAKPKSVYSFSSETQFNKLLVEQ